MERIEKAALLLNKPIGMVVAVVGFVIGILLAKAII